MSDFDPNRYIIKLKGKDYLEVKWRLLWLRTEHPDAIIHTELIRLDEDRGSAVFNASVIIPSGGQASGYGSETGKDFGDYLEKAETKAIGRALAALGYGTQFCGDDLSEGSRIVDSPVSRPNQSVALPAQPLNSGEYDHEPSADEVFNALGSSSGTYVNRPIPENELSPCVKCGKPVKQFTAKGTGKIYFREASGGFHNVCRAQAA